MARKFYRKCMYNDCMLPKNNNRYWFQFICFAISLVFMQIDTKDFTLLSVFIFTIPIVLDLLYTDLKGKTYNFIKSVFLILNIIIIFVCIVGQFGMLIDNGAYFSVVKTSMIGAGTIINKNIFLLFISFDLLVPILLFYGCPNQRTNEALSFILEKKGA